MLRWRKSFTTEGTESTEEDLRRERMDPVVDAALYHE
jgi:hypothetical protein